MLQPRPLVDAFFLDTPAGQRFCLYHAPLLGRPLLGAVLYIHPFAEELNRSRRLAALQARAFAETGFAVLQIDLGGCGDSSGDFGEANWRGWADDAALALQWLRARIDAAAPAQLATSPAGKPLWLWGLRSGCLLAAELARQRADLPLHLLFWQPVLSGRQHLTQFLRLGMASDLVQGKKGSGTDGLMGQLQAGQSVEVAGYAISPGLALGLAQARMDLDAGSPVFSSTTTVMEMTQPRHIVCFELIGLENAKTPRQVDGQVEEAGISPALAAQMGRWRLSGCKVSARAVAEALFWQTPETSLCTHLVEASTRAVGARAAVNFQPSP